MDDLAAVGPPYMATSEFTEYGFSGTFADLSRRLSADLERIPERARRLAAQLADCRRRGLRPSRFPRSPIVRKVVNDGR